MQHEVDHLDGVLILDRTPGATQRRGRLRCPARGWAEQARPDYPRAKLRTVYLGTSKFAAAVLSGLPDAPIAPPCRDAGPTPPGRGPPVQRRRPWRARRGRSAWRWRSPTSQRGGDAARGSPRPRPAPLVVCAFGALMKRAVALRARDDQRPPVAAAALARRGAGRAGDDGRRCGDGRRDHAPHRRARQRAGVPAGCSCSAPGCSTTRRRRSWRR